MSGLSAAGGPTSGVTLPKDLNSPTTAALITACRIAGLLLLTGIVCYTSAMTSSYEYLTTPLDPDIFSQVCLGFSAGSVLCNLAAAIVDKNEGPSKILTLIGLVSSIALTTLFAFSTAGMIATEIPAYVNIGVYVISMLGALWLKCS